MELNLGTLAHQHREGDPKQENAPTDRERLHGYPHVTQESPPHKQEKQGHPASNEDGPREGRAPLAYGQIRCHRDEHWGDCDRIDDNQQHTENSPVYYAPILIYPIGN